MRRIHNPKHVTTIAKAAAMAALGELDRVNAFCKEVREGRERIYSMLDQNKVHYYQSVANFVLIRLPDAKGLIQALEADGIMVRDRTRYFEGVGHVRITVGSLKSTEIVLGALQRYFSRT